MTMSEKTVDLADLYENGLAKPHAVPPGCPILTSGSAHPRVEGLIRVLNRELGTELQIGDTITQDVLSAVRSLRSRYQVPAEQFPGRGIDDTSAWIGPNTWAAVAAIDNA